jgi:hypothetical protein
MRIRARLVLLTCCCAALTACSASAPKGPDATVTVPSVGRPVAPSSAQAALSSEAFTPYADLGASLNDGLAPGDTYAALHTACMNAAGYGQYAASAPFGVRENRGLGFPQPFGPWGYLGTSLAAQYGFNAPESVPDGTSEGPPPDAGTMPAGAQSATGKCLNIVMAFNDAMFTTALAGIETMNNDISTDVIQDPDFKKAVKSWSACMAKNGFVTVDADAFAQQQLVNIGLRVAPGSKTPSMPSPPTAAQNKAQIAMAVTDADCTQSTDLAGIYFAEQADYEQQFVTANQQALNAAVRDYKADFAKELSKLPELLKTTSATPQFGGRPVPGGPGRRSGKPSATPSRS